MVSLSGGAPAQGTIPSSAKLGGDGVHPALTTAEISADIHLEIHRDTAALRCPDASQLREALLAQRPNASPGKLRIAIEFRRQGDAFAATFVATGARSGSRALQLETKNCQALLHPLVVSLTLLLDPDAELPADEQAPPPDPATEVGSSAGSGSASATKVESGARSGTVAATKVGIGTRSGTAAPFAEQPRARQDPSTGTRGDTAVAPVPVRPRAPAAPKPLPRDPNQKNAELDPIEAKPGTARSSSRALELGLDLGPQLVVGLVPRTAYGLELQGVARYGFLALRMAAAGCAAETSAHADGRVRAQTYYGRLGLCGQWQALGPFSLALCQGSWLGRFVVQGSGFATDRSASPWFVAVGAFIDASWSLHDRFGVYLRSGGFAPMTRHNFNVDGVDAPALRSEAFGAWVGLGVAWRFR